MSWETVVAFFHEFFEQGLSIIDYAILIFILMESSNIFILYFCPTFPYGNGVSVFCHWKDSEGDPKTHLFNRYMACWVAGTKLIFIMLLFLIVLFADEWLKIMSGCIMVISIASYFFKLHPIMRELDEMGQITPKGYSKTLDAMIIGFMLMFSAAVVIQVYPYFI